MSVLKETISKTENINDASCEVCVYDTRPTLSNVRYCLLHCIKRVLSAFPDFPSHLCSSNT